MLDEILLMIVVINPFSKMLFTILLCKEYSGKELLQIVVRSNAIALLILSIFSFAGYWILKEFFHISIYSLRIAGGIVLAKIGFDYLDKGATFVVKRTKSLLEISAVPIATPLIAGPAAIATVVTISVESGVLASVIALSVGILINFLLMIFALVFSKRIGETLIIVLIRILGLFIMALGVEMLLSGVVGYLNLT